MIKRTLIAVAALTLFSCKTDKEKVIASTWKYQDGYHIGDVIEFKNNYFTIDDSCKIYKDGVYSGRVEKVTGKELEIKSIDNEVGYYIFFEVVK